MCDSNILFQMHRNVAEYEKGIQTNDQEHFVQTEAKTDGKCQVVWNLERKNTCRKAK